MIDPKNPFAHLVSAPAKPTTPAKPTIPEKAKPATLVAPAKPTLGGTRTVAAPAPTPVEPPRSLPAVLNPITNLMVPTTVPEMAHPSHVIASGSAHDLAALNTDSFDPQTRVEKPINAKAAERTKQVILDSGRSVREVADAVDRLIEEDPQLRGPNLIQLRSYIMTLMTTLKAHPEFDEVLIDQDSHNIMKFVRATREEALALRETKTEKKAIKAIKKAGSISNRAFGDSDKFDKLFNQIVLGTPGKM